VVVYMGLLGLPVLCAGLVAHGLPADTPAAVVQQGTTREQRVVTGTLRTLAGQVADAMLTPPTLIIIGDVVRLRERLNWYRPGEAARVPLDRLPADPKRVSP
jgi:uroporphyrin-III C-methyltransferase/precorrin-2 dehydrogenase/sirohydrochlorin ferrochelatase